MLELKLSPSSSSSCNQASTVLSYLPPQHVHKAPSALIQQIISLSLLIYCACLIFFRAAQTGTRTETERHKSRKPTQGLHPLPSQPLAFYTSFKADYSAQSGTIWVPRRQSSGDRNTGALRVSHFASISPNQTILHITALHISESRNPFSEERKLRMYSVPLRFSTYIIAQPHCQEDVRLSTCNHHQGCRENSAPT